MAIKLDSGDVPIWMRMAAKKGGLRGSGTTYTKSSLDKQTKTVVGLIHDWAAARSNWQSAIEAIRSADADAWLGRGPDDRDHLTIQLQPDRNSQKAPPKPGQHKKPKRPV
ncbi:MULTISPECIES: hypothetical protein [unclassified Mesorhizobium]|uniref:hypothetical protein n=1 Tax=unclassified Mesorhizobium TaxID=325217 RepID=UPI0012EC5D7E|nr:MULTISPECIES: hypothetical protein [unclassified Mesorhizobium]WJI72866.1 hypothetical protein NLY37_17675 [Mesorhizobium sp. C395A]